MDDYKRLAYEMNLLHNFNPYRRATIGCQYNGVLICITTTITGELRREVPQVTPSVNGNSRDVKRHFRSTMIDLGLDWGIISPASIRLLHWFPWMMNWWPLYGNPGSKYAWPMKYSHKIYRIYLWCFANEDQVHDVFEKALQQRERTTGRFPALNVLLYLGSTEIKLFLSNSGCAGHCIWCVR